MKRRAKAQAATASAPPVPARYYRAADRAGAGLILWLPVVGVSGGIVLGAIYTFLAGLFQELESPGWMVVVTPLYAAGLALLALAVCRLGDVRGRRLRLAVSV